MITDINIFGERNSGTNFLNELLCLFNRDRIIFDKTKHAFPSIEQLTDCERKKLYCPNGDYNFLGDNSINVLISRNIFTWCLRMSEKRYHYDKNFGLNYDLHELITKNFISDQERKENKEHSEFPLCQGEEEYFESFTPYIGIIDLRNKKYKKWIELLNNKNFYILNYDKLINLDSKEINKVKKICNINFNKSDIEKNINKLKIKESHYLNKDLINNNFNNKILKIITTKIDFELEKILGFDYSNILNSYGD